MQNKGRAGREPAAPTSTNMNNNQPESKCSLCDNAFQVILQSNAKRNKLLSSSSS